MLKARVPLGGERQETGCLSCFACLRKLFCCNFKHAPPAKVARSVNSLKRVVIFRHGEGRHQTDRVMTKGLGPALTELGLRQAYGVRSNKIFESALATAKQPIFVASNVVRAVETMWHAAPGCTIIIQPLLRERIADEFDWPSRLDLLEQWLSDHQVDADLTLYRRELERFGLGKQGDDTYASPDGAGAVCAGVYERFIQSLQEADGTGRMGGDAQESKSRAKELVKWMGEMDADTIFIASHGAFLQYLNLMASQSWTGAAWATLTGSGYMANCEVREHRLVRCLEPTGWLLTDASAQDIPRSVTEAKPALGPLAALDLPSGRCRIKLCTPQGGQEGGWYLTARRTRGSDRRSDDSTFVIVHSPVADHYRGHWQINRSLPGVYTVSFASRDEDQDSGWFLTARRSQKQDKRDKESTFAIIHRNLNESYVSTWQFLEGSGPRKCRICISGYQGGVFLTAHRSLPAELRSEKSTYAMVVEGFEEELVAEWELETLPD